MLLVQFRHIAGQAENGPQAIGAAIDKAACLFDFLLQLRQLPLASRRIDYDDHAAISSRIYKMKPIKKRRPERAFFYRLCFCCRQCMRSTHRQELLRKPAMLFTPIKKANAKKVAPAKRGKILGLPGRCRCNVHVENNLAFSYGKNCCHCIRQQLLCQPLVGKSAHPVSSVIFYRCRFRTIIVKNAAATATSPAAA